LSPAQEKEVEDFSISLKMIEEYDIENSITFFKIEEQEDNIILPEVEDSSSDIEYEDDKEPEDK